jgi:hypothetical protein
VPTAIEKLQFQNAASGMRDWYVKKYGIEWLDKLDHAIRECELEIDSAYEDAARS